MSESRPERKRRLDTEHKEVRAALKKAKTIAAAAIKRMTLCGKARATALSIYMIANQELEPVIVYLRGIGRQRHWDEIACGDDVLTCCITDLFMQAADEELVSLLDPTLTPFPQALKKAHSVVHAWRATEWTAMQNARGHQPSSVVVHIHAERQRLLVPEELRPRRWGDAGTDRSRQMLRRLRIKYGGRFGQLPAAPDISREDMRSKAIPRFACATTIGN